MENQPYTESDGAKMYQKSKQMRWRRVLEIPNFENLSKQYEVQDAIDLACGEGFYTRKLRKHCKGKVIGVDIAKEMIDLAHQQECEGIEYQVGDCFKELTFDEKFDLAASTYLLVYASTIEQLERCVSNIYSLLKPGGRFIGIHINPYFLPEDYQYIPKYGMSYTLQDETLRDGAVLRFDLEEKALDIQQVSYGNYFTPQTIENAFRKAGFIKFKWVQWKPYDKEEELPFWQDFVEHPFDSNFEAWRPLEDSNYTTISYLPLRPLTQFEVQGESLWKEEPRFNPTVHIDMGSITCHYNEANHFVHTSPFMILSRLGHEVWRKLIDLSTERVKDISEENILDTLEQKSKFVHYFLRCQVLINYLSDIIGSQLQYHSLILNTPQVDQSAKIQNAGDDRVSSLVISLGDLTSDIDYIAKKLDYDVKVEQREESHNDESIVEHISKLQTGWAMLVKGSDLVHRIQTFLQDKQNATLIINFAPLDHIQGEADILGERVRQDKSMEDASRTEAKEVQSQLVEGDEQ